MFKYEVFEKAKKQMTIPIVFIYHEYAGHVVANRLATNLDQIYTFLKLSQSYLGPTFVFAWARSNFSPDLTINIFKPFQLAIKNKKYLKPFQFFSLFNFIKKFNKNPKIYEKVIFLFEILP